MIIPICIPTNSAQGFPFLHTLANTNYLLFFVFYDSHPNRHKVISHYSQLHYSMQFWFAFLWWLVMFKHLWCTYWPFVCLLSENVHLFWSFAHFLIGLFSFWVVWVSYIFYILTPYQVYGLQILSPIPRLFLNFVDCFLCCAEAF